MPRPHYSTLVLTLIVDVCATEFDSAEYISLYSEQDKIWSCYNIAEIGIRVHM